MFHTNKNVQLFKTVVSTCQSCLHQFSTKHTNIKITRPTLTHVDGTGCARMVDISQKRPTFRRATAQGRVQLNKEAFRLVKENKLSKGDVLQVARVAGIMGAKKTSELIPLCHQVPLSQVKVDLRLDEGSQSVVVTVKASTNHSTGVEMEALTGVQVCALTIYDMCKSAGQEGMRVEEMRVVRKEGGKQGVVEFNS